MTQSRVPLKTIVKNQLPFYVRSEFPLIGEFLSQYYQSQEFQGAPVDLVQNIDRYIKLNNNTNVISSVLLRSDVEDTDTTINVFNTQGFPEEYGLIRIGNEIITYTGKPIQVLLVVYADFKDSSKIAMEILYFLQAYLHLTLMEVQ